jgi:competence protein ComEC
MFETTTMQKGVFHKRPFLYIVPFFILGIWMTSRLPIDSSIGLVVLLTGLISMAFSKRFKLPAFIGLFVAFIGLGLTIGAVHFEKPEVEFGAQETVWLNILEADQSDKDWHKVIAEVRYRKSKVQYEECESKVLLYSNDLVQKGDQLLAVVDFQSIRNKGNPGEFDAETYWRNKGIRSMAFLVKEDYTMIDHEPISPVDKFFDGLRSHFSSIIRENFKGETAAIAMALLLGEKGELSVATKSSFSNAGAMHMLAVSGLHVGIIMYLLMFLLQRTSRFITKKKAVVISVILVWCYAGVTGFSPSVMRAAFMFSILMIGGVFSRKTEVMNSLFFSAFVLLMLGPSLLYDIGFQLSYLALLGILTCFEPLSKLFYIKNKWLRKVWEGTMVGVAAQVFTVPLTLYYFHQFPNYFMVSNLGVMLFAGVLLSLGLLLFAFSWLSWLKPIVVVALSFGLMGLLFFIQFVEALPGSVAFGFTPSAFIVLVLFVLILGAVFLKPPKRLLLAMLSLILIVIGTIQWDRMENIQVSEIVVFNNNSPVITVKKGERIHCFYQGGKSKLNKVERLVETYSKVRPGEIEYTEMSKGKFSIQLPSENVTLEVNKDGVLLTSEDSKCFLKTRYGNSSKRGVKQIEMPYLAASGTAYNLSDGAFVIPLGD